MHATRSKSGTCHAGAVKATLAALVLLFCVSLTHQAHAQTPPTTPETYQDIKSDWSVPKLPSYFRNWAPHLPMLSYGVGFGYRPAYFAPSAAQVAFGNSSQVNSSGDNLAVSPRVSVGVSWSLSASLGQFGVLGWWSDLSFSASWGLSQGLSDNIDTGRYARQVLVRDLGFGISKSLFTERITGFTFSFGLGANVPLSPSSRQSTLITSLSPSLSVGRSFWYGRLRLGYSFSTNFNFYLQDSGVYNPDLAGIPGLNQRWGMTHAISMGFTPFMNFSVGLSLFFGVGYSFADAYASPDGPQVFGADSLTPADLASYPLNEGNSYGISLSVSYRFNRWIGLSLRYSNAGPQFEFQNNANGERIWTVRNPFRLQYGSFGLSLSGSV
ncbi:MAG: hypothetical protein H6727_03500 [Myxococcales bacterium]|nr:hypothetical protein [Myxococcales bacterium]